MALYIPWLADAAKLTGYPVVEIAGWRNAGHGGMRAAEGVGGHHTANPQPGDYPSLRIVRDGRADLLGPLSHLGLGRSGTTYIIAAGLCYHAGASSWAGLHDLNDEFIGIEAESSGVRDDWTPEQRDAYPRLVAALLFYMRRGAERFAGHRELCRPPGRKIDPAYWDLTVFRKRVAWLLEDPLARIPRFAHPPAPRVIRKDHKPVITLPRTPPPSDPNSDPAGWAQRNHDVIWNVTGGWEGDCAFSFGVQDWAGRSDNVRGYLRMASWITPTGRLTPVSEELAGTGKGRVLTTHTPTQEYPAPRGCVGVTLNYAAPAEAGAYVALGRSA